MTIRNVLYIMCDQLRWDHLGCAGHPFLKTPNIDALAARGVRFAQAYVQSGICGPSRMSAYTGRYVSSHGATHNRVPLSVGEVTLGWHLRESGRTLALAGKTHMLPDARGMKRLLLDGQDELAVLLREGWFTLVDRHDGHHAETDSAYADWLRSKGYDCKDPWTDWVVAVTDETGATRNGWKMRNARYPARVREEHSETAYTTDRAIAFMEQQGDAPWVLHLSYVKPHWPYIAPAPYHAMYSPEQCLPVARHEAERGNDAHPVLREFQNEEVAQSFQLDDCIATVRPAYQGLIAHSTIISGACGRRWSGWDGATTRSSSSPPIMATISATTGSARRSCSTTACSACRCWSSIPRRPPTPPAAPWTTASSRRSTRCRPCSMHSASIRRTI